MSLSDWRWATQSLWIPKGCSSVFLSGLTGCAASPPTGRHTSRICRMTSSRFILRLPVSNRFREPKQLVQKSGGAFFVGGIVRRSVVLETFLHARHGQVFRNWKSTHADDDQPQLREAVDAA